MDTKVWYDKWGLSNKGKEAETSFESVVSRE
jgi:hypothetical protein